MKTEIKTNTYTYQHIAILMLCAVVAFTFSIEPAHAAGLGGLEKALQSVVDVLTGTVGRLLGIIAVAACGILWAFSVIDLRKAGAVCLGIVVLFSAAEFVDLLKG